jgi:hypothetical protein
MFQTLTAQHLQLGALDAAAKAALSTEDFQIFAAAVSTAESSQTPRNHLAHWAWGACEQRPDLLVLANPKMLRERDFRVAKGVASKVEPRKIAELNLFDVSEALAYSKSDLERALRDLEECYFILEFLATYLNPDQLTGMGFLPADTDLSTIRAEILQRLNEQRLFREALARIPGDQQSTQQVPPGSLEPRPGE